jgi:hypothetical protein
MVVSVQQFAEGKDENPKHEYWVRNRLPQGMDLEERASPDDSKTCLNNGAFPDCLYPHGAPMARLDWTSWTPWLGLAGSLLYVILQIWAVYAWTGSWRIRALAPLVILLILSLARLFTDLVPPLSTRFSVYAVPLFGLTYLWAVAIARAIANRRAAP